MEGGRQLGNYLAEGGGGGMARQIRRVACRMFVYEAIEVTCVIRREY